MVAFPKSLNLDFEGSFVENSPDLSWIANNTAKVSPCRPDTSEPECWTLMSTREFGSLHKVRNDLYNLQLFFGSEDVPG